MKINNPRVHISLNVADLSKSVAFYEAFFGVPAHKIRPGYANFDLDSPGIKLALNQSPALSSGGIGPLNHLGIQLTSVDDVAAARKRLADSGLIELDEGDTVCCFARQDKVWARDPDGNSWEVYVLLDDMTDDQLAAHSTEARSPSEPVCCAPPQPLLTLARRPQK